MIVPLIQILIGTTAVTDLCPAAKILPMHRTQAVPLPAIVLERDGASPNDSKDTTSKMDEDRVSVSCYAESYVAAHALAEQVRLAIDGYRGTQSGYQVESVRYTGSTDGFMDDNEKVFRVTQEYIVMIKRDGIVVADQDMPANPYMLKSVYDSNNNGKVDTAENLEVTAISGKTLLSPLDGTEEVLINDGGTLKKTTTQDIADLNDGGGLSDGNYGAFTVSGGVAQLGDEVVDTDQYAHNSISNDKLYHMAQNTIKGRISAGAGDPEDLTANQLSTILDGATDPFLRTSDANFDPSGSAASALSSANSYTDSEIAALDAAAVGADPAGSAAAAETAANAYTDSEILAIEPIEVLSFQALGSEIKVMPIRGRFADITTSYSLTNQQATYLAFYNEKPRTLTGVNFWQNANGVYTASNYNGFGLYSYSAGVLTKVAETANNAALFTSGATTNRKEPFTSPYVAAIGIYYVLMVRNSTAAGTAPTVAGFAAMLNANMQLDFTNNALFCGIASGVTSLPASLNASSLTKLTTSPALFLY